jgi:hypothetical protein
LTISEVTENDVLGDFDRDECGNPTNGTIGKMTAPFRISRELLTH